MHSSAMLERVLQGKLNKARSNRSGLDDTEARRADRRPGIRILRVIEGIEKLRAKIQRAPFAQATDVHGL